MHSKGGQTVKLFTHSLSRKRNVLAFYMTKGVFWYFQRVLEEMLRAQEVTLKIKKQQKQAK
jgi:hypothetical protein